MAITNIRSGTQIRVASRGLTLAQGDARYALIADAVSAARVGTAISAATAKTTPVDADTIGLSDSAASSILKKLTWANLKTTLKTYLDAFYLVSPHFTGTPTSANPPQAEDSNILATTAFVKVNLLAATNARIAADNTEIAARSAADNAETALRLAADEILTAAVTTARSELLSEPAVSELASLWSATVTGEPKNRAAISVSEIAFNGSFGQVIQITGAAKRAPRAIYRMLPGHKYKVEAAAVRSTNPTDPLGDSVSLKAAWLSAAKAQISAESLEDFNLLGSTPHYYSKIVALVAGSEVDEDAPSGTVYFTPYVETFGADGVTHIFPYVRVTDLTSNTVISADVTGLDARLSALEGADLDNRVTVVEGLIAGAKIARFESRDAAEAAALASDIPATVDIVEALNDVTDVDGLAQRFTRVGVEPVGGDYFPDGVSGFWERSYVKIKATGSQVARSAEERSSDFIYANDYTRLWHAIAAATGKTLIINGEHDWDSAVEGALFDQPIRIIGDGMHSSRILFTALPDTVDAITINPDPATIGEDLFGWMFEGFRVVRSGAGIGRRGMNIALDDTATEFLAKLALRDVWVGPFGTRALSFAKGAEGGAAPTNINGLFTSVIEDCRFDGGPDADRVVSLENSGDSLQWLRNTVTGTGLGIYTEAVSGAVRQTFEDGNITATGGAFYAKGGSQGVLNRVQMEQSSDYTGDQDAQVVMDGATNWEITNNNLNGFARVSNIRFKGGATRNNCYGNTMFCSAAKFHFVFDADAEVRNSIGGQRNRYLDHDGTTTALLAQPRVSDLSGKAQIGVYMAQTLQNSWAAASASGFDEGLWAALLDDGEVVFKGWIAGGTNTAGTTIATLPVQMRPLVKAKRIYVGVLNGSTWQTWPLQVLTNGQIQVLAQVLPATTLVGFDHTRFNVY